MTDINYDYTTPRQFFALHHMSSEVTIMLDDSQILTSAIMSASILTLQNTPAILSGMYFNDTLVWFNSTDEVLISFEGISLELFGEAIGPINQKIQVDFEEVNLNATFGSQWYTSPTLPASVSTSVGMDGINNMSINYALVAVTAATDLHGKTILVDDLNPEINWSGNWETRINLPFSATSLSPDMNEIGSNGNQTIFKLPHGNGTHISRNIGDSFTFQFAGTSILVSGVSPNADPFNVGAVSLVFELDGERTNIHLPTRNPEVLMHQVYFQNNSLSSGNHTLTGTVTDVIGNGSAIIDYLTYKPSFDSLSTKPDFPDIPNSITTTPSGSPTTFPSPTSISNPNNSSAPLVAGTTIGAVLFLVVLSLAVWYLRKKSRKRRSLSGSQTPNPAIEPFTTKFSNANITSEKRSPGGQSGTPREMWQKSSKRVQAFHDPSYPQSQNDISDQNLVQEFEPHAQSGELHPHATNLSEPNRSPANAESRDEMATRIREIQAQIGILTREMNRHIVPPPYASQNRSDLESGREQDNEFRIREMQAQVGVLTREINRHMVPPSYVSQDGSVVGTEDGIGTTRSL
ncbi:hypothetical protein VKT23_020226 [Stygiomarasmius scandens]|uniref:Uncharacterized protein n=1 Tax=Marasmiellus scandens TaxID=2682957 RepID=A0ABR1INK1_9AGAR